MYGFYEEIQSRFNHGDSIAVYKAFNKVFRCFPLVALVAGEIIFVLLTRENVSPGPRNNSPGIYF